MHTAHDMRSNTHLPMDYDGEDQKQQLTHIDMYIRCETIQEPHVHASRHAYIEYHTTAHATHQLHPLASLVQQQQPLQQWVRPIHFLLL